MKKVLIINTTLNKGGAARVAYSLYEKLNPDFNIFFAYGRGSKNKNDKSFYFGNRIEFFLHVILVRFFGLEGFGSYFSTKKLIKFIKKEKFDLINIHNLHGYYVNFFTLINFLKESKIPIIYSLHDEWPITWLPAHSLGCEHCKNGEGVCVNKYKYPKNYFPFFTKYMLLKKRMMFDKDLNITIICPSLWLKNSIENSFLKQFDIKVVHNSIDTNIFRPILEKSELRKKYKIPVDKKIILFSASNLNDKSKGIDYIKKTAQILKKEPYLFVGLGGGHIGNIINIKTMGYVYDKKMLAELYSLSDLFCFASSAETFLLSVAESLACGVPVVGFDIPVVRELINNNVGVLSSNNSESLSEEIDTLLKNDFKRLEMSKNGRELIVSSYSNHEFYKSYVDVYNNALNKNI